MQCHWASGIMARRLTNIGQATGASQHVDDVNGVACDDTFDVVGFSSAQVMKSRSLVCKIALRTVSALVVSNTPDFVVITLNYGS